MGFYLNPDNDGFQSAVRSEIYVDKTGLIGYTNKWLNTEQRYVCVSRPRRFGKSITLKMLAAYYSCGCDSAELFAGFKIESDVTYREHLNRYDVLFLNMQQFLIESGNQEITQYLEREVVEELQEEYGDCLPEQVTGLAQALRKIYVKTKKKFIFLIDEWDCVMRERQESEGLQRRYLDFLRNLLKDQPYVALAYATGILPVKKYGQHSALNMFWEYSMINQKALEEYTGFTDDEVKGLCRRFKMDYEETSGWYDGYVFVNVRHIYNPRSVVEAMCCHRFSSYWTSTETYDALKIYIDMDFDGLRADIAQMLGGGRIRVNTFSFQNDMRNFKTKDDVLTLLIHLGYLGYDSETEEAFIPNKEIIREFENAMSVGGWTEIMRILKASEKLLEDTLKCDEKSVAIGLDHAHTEAASILTISPYVTESKEGFKMEKWARAMYQPSLPLGENGQRLTGSREHVELSKNAAKEGMVLLKNEGGLLPFAKGTKLAVFGKAAFDYVKGGGGSGDVTVAYVRNLYEGLKMQQECVSIYEPLCDYYRKDVERQYAEGHAPGMTVEPAVPQELLARARAYTDTALVTICRFSGEGWDRKSVVDDNKEHLSEGERQMAEVSAKIFKDGDFNLSVDEAAMVAAVKQHFPKVAVVMNVGGMVDTSWFVNDDRIGAVLMAWQGGIEGGLAAAELLTGKGNPSGKLSDTFAGSLEDYPSTYNFHESKDYVDYTEDIYVGYRYFETIPGAAQKVNYPFGFGLSYTTFEVEADWAGEQDGTGSVRARVTNTGHVAGKEVVQVYFEAPQGLLGKPARQLIAFGKTRELKPGETQTLMLTFAMEDMASYDDLGKVQKSAYVLEAGTYAFYVGTSVRDVHKLSYAYTVAQNRVTRQLTERMAPTQLAKRMLADGSFETLPQKEPNDPNADELVRMSEEQMDGYTPEVRAREAYKVWKTPYREGARPFTEVAEGKMSVREFLAQLSDEDVACLLGGQPNLGVANTFGYGNLPAYGVPSVMTADGPAGLRIKPECGVTTTCWPCSTLLACTWDPAVVEAVGAAGGAEVKENNIALWLTPAVNIHRSPLCGRNFEYYSEDPFLAGKLAAAMVRGIQSNRIGATVKHFALNNKETNRKNSDSRASERAVREIYLKAFEIIVKEADPWSIMTSYNIINGHRASENRDLLEGILREEWGYEGCVTTDWWTCGEHYKEVKAGNDVKMGCGHPARLLEALEKGCLTRQEMDACAERILEMILKID